MTTQVRRAFGTAEQIRDQLVQVTPQFIIEDYDSKAATASPALEGGNTGVVTFSDQAGQPGTGSAGSLQVLSGAGQTGTAVKFGANLLTDSGSIDLSDREFVSVSVNFNDSAFAKLTSITDGNRIVLYTFVPNARAIWNFSSLDIPAANQWVTITKTLASPDFQNNFDLANIVNTEVSWSANNVTDGSEAMLIDTMEVDNAAPGALIYSMDFDMKGDGTERSAAWVAYDDGL